MEVRGPETGHMDRGTNDEGEGPCEDEADHIVNLEHFLNGVGVCCSLQVQIQVVVLGCLRDLLSRMLHGEGQAKVNNVRDDYCEAHRKYRKSRTK